MPDKAMTKREEAIGRAACDGHPTCSDHWETLDDVLRDAWITEGLAAVAEERRIDTCETCKHENEFNIHLCNRGYDTGGYGCNRHEPKGE